MCSSDLASSLLDPSKNQDHLKNIANNEMLGLASLMDPDVFNNPEHFMGLSNLMTVDPNHHELPIKNINSRKN